MERRESDPQEDLRHPHFGERSREPEAMYQAKGKGEPWA
jgi:hypothetical protein